MNRRRFLGTLVYGVGGAGAFLPVVLSTAAKSAGVKDYFVEMSLDLMKASTAYLHGLKV